MPFSLQRVSGAFLRVAEIFILSLSRPPGSLHLLYTKSDRIKMSGNEAEEAVMQDFLFLGTVLVFFVIAIGYTYGCDRL